MWKLSIRLAAACLLVLGTGGAAFGQQNLFNVPSGQITKSGTFSSKSS